MSVQRAKGTRWETEVVQYLQSRGYHCWRTGSADFGAGDIAGFDDWTLECKNQKAWALAEWTDQTVRASERNENYPVLVVKRPRKPALNAYAVMPLWAWAERCAR